MILQHSRSSENERNEKRDEDEEAHMDKRSHPQQRKEELLFWIFVLFVIGSPAGDIG